MNFASVVWEGAYLLSEQGENHEYDRAIAEIVTFTGGGTSDDVENTMGKLRALRNEEITLVECANSINLNEKEHLTNAPMGIY